MTDEATIHELPPARVKELSDAGQAQVVDVRTQEEREAGHLPGSAHIPLERLEQSAGEMDREWPVVFYCRGGDRSAMAADAFRASGWDASSMEGGIVAWAEGGLPLEPERGEIGSPSGLPPK
ncbi:MAG: rhodanese-like domain-containing protein [Thermoleophilaceae bacterium]